MRCKVRVARDAARRRGAAFAIYGGGGDTRAAVVSSITQRSATLRRGGRSRRVVPNCMSPTRRLQPRSTGTVEPQESSKHEASGTSEAHRARTRVGAGLYACL